MKAVMSSVPPGLLEWRRAIGADRWDEMWEGVLHMGPSPNLEHQRFEGALEVFLNLQWAKNARARVYHTINLSPGGDWTKDYRVPDLVILTSATRAIEKDEYIEGPPDVVIEIRSPGDESLEKLGFYAGLGVPEVWIFDRDSKTPTLYKLAGEEYAIAAASADGWYRSAVTQLEFRVIRPGKLTMRLERDESTEEDLP